MSNNNSQMEILEIYTKLNNLPIDFLQYITACSVCENKEDIIEEYIIKNSLDKIKKDLELYDFYYKFNNLNDAYFKRFVDELNLKGNSKHDQIIYLLENYSLTELNKYYKDISEEIETDITKKNFLSKNEYNLDFLLNLNNIEPTNNEEQDLLFYIMNTPLDKIKKDLELYDFYYKFNDLNDAYFKRFVDELNLKGNSKHDQIIYLLENYSLTELNKYYKDISREIKTDLSKKNFLSKNEYDLNFLLNLNNIKSTNNEEQDLLFYIMNTPLDKIKKDLELCNLFTQFLKVPDEYLLEFFEEYEKNDDKNKQILFLINNHTQNELNDILKSINMKIEEDNSKKLFFKTFKLLNSFSEDKLIGILIESGLSYSDNKQENIESILKHLDITTINKMEKQYEEKIDLTKKLLNKDLKITLKENKLPISNKKQENIDTILKNLDLNNIIQNKEMIEEIKKQIHELDDFTLHQILFMNNIKYPGNKDDLEYIIMENVSLSRIEKNINDLKPMLKFIGGLKDIELQIILKEKKLSVSNIREENVNIILKNLYYEDLIKIVKSMKRIRFKLYDFDENLLSKILSMNNIEYNDNNIALDCYILRYLFFYRINKCIKEINSMLKLIDKLSDGQIKMILEEMNLPISKSKQNNINIIFDNFNLHDLKMAINKLPKRQKTKPTYFMIDYIRKLTGNELLDFINTHGFPNGGSKEENRRIILRYATEDEFIEYIKRIHPEFKMKDV